MGIEPVHGLYSGPLYRYSSVPIAFVLSRYTGIHVLVIYACVQLADLIKCVIGFVLVKKGVWLQNIVSS